MASPIKNNDDSNLTTTTSASPMISEAATIITTNTTNLANSTTTNLTTINANGINNADIDSSSAIKNGDVDTTSTSTATATVIKEKAIETTTIDNGVVIGKSIDSPTSINSGTTTISSPNLSPQTAAAATSAPRAKPLEKPKPLKLAENSHQHQHHQHQAHHASQPHLLYHPAGPGAYAALGAPQMIGAIPHSIFAHHLPQQTGAALAHHVQSAIHQHNQHQQQQQNMNHQGDGAAAVSTDEILETMEQINRSVKAGQFSTTLAGHIFRLYSYLKHVGELLELSHKNEMNRVFVSLRQACCRDSGQLGTPCRLKIMELVELRAMGWRPNLAHSQYYLNRGGGSLTNGFNGGQAMIPEYNPLSSTDAMSGGDMEQLGAAPVSAPPFGTFPMNPFAFNLPPTSMSGGGPVTSAADLVSSAVQNMAQSQPSYYLIPASHVGHTQAGIAFISPTAAATVLPPPPMSPNMAASVAAHHAAAHQQQQRLHMPVAASLSQPMLTAVGINSSTSPTLQLGASSGFFPKGAVTKTSGKYTRPAKVPGKSQYRDEVIIRNADSGKIMGVKGRRVAIIEELSKTIISFQKVPQGAKERTLTITGPTEESIDQAKILIDETIRRNVSPVRGEGDIGEAYRGASLISACFGDDGEDHENGDDGEELSDEGGEEGKEDGGGDRRQDKENEFTMESGQLGEMLKLQCNDPALLEAAKQALAAYFRGNKPGHQALRRTTTDAAARDQARKERRKSMPTLDNQRLLALKQSSPPKMQEQSGNEEGELANAEGGEEESDQQQEVAGAAEGGKTNKPLTLTMMISPPIGKQKASSAARSTPNLAATGFNKRALCMMKSMDTNGSARGGGVSTDDIETKYMADESGGAALVIHEKKNRVTVRVVYTREFVLQCAASPFTSLTPAALPWVMNEAPEILRQIPGKFDINEYKQTCLELRQQSH